jgi:hypothetical protein
MALSKGPEQWRVGTGRLRQIVAYSRKVFDLGIWLGRVEDARRKPLTAPRLVAAAVFFTGLLRIRSFNALEPRLSERPFVRLVGAPGDGAALCSVDTLSRALRVMGLDSVRSISTSMVAKAERNKVFREGWHGALRYFALDGWEPIRSRHRHCRECLVRRVKVKGKGKDSGPAEVEEYYHRYVVAMLIDGRFDLALDIEPLRPADLRPAVVKGKKKDRLVKLDEDEGELTAAMRLLKRVKRSFGWLDVVVADALYANGPFLNAVKALGLGAVIVARKETDEPLKEALRIWSDEPPHKIVHTDREQIALWDCPDLETLSTYEGKIRVVKAEVSWPAEPQRTPSTWSMVATGLAARRLAPHKVLAVARGRWHIENTGFHQWTTRWRFTHVFLHSGPGILALYWLFFAAFNLLSLFLYCQLKSYGRDATDVTRTISRLIDEMLDELPRLAWDTS